MFETTATRRARIAYETIAKRHASWSHAQVQATAVKLVPLTNGLALQPIANTTFVHPSFANRG